MSENRSADQREITILDSVNESVFTVDGGWRITAFKAEISGAPCGVGCQAQTRSDPFPSAASRFSLQ